MIDLFKVYMSDEVIAYLQPVLASGYVGEGEVSRKFESALGEYLDNPNVVVVNSGTSAITLALRLAGVGPGTSVVTTPMTCLATNMPILSLGAHPIWADILPDGTIDPEDVLRKVRQDTRAILCMDWGGLPCHLMALRAIADARGVLLIEDACQAFGARYLGHPIGRIADVVCLSFQAIKYLTTIDGGALIVNHGQARLAHAKLLRWFGLDRTKSAMLRCGQDPPDWGYKFQTNDVASAIGLANLPGLADRLQVVRDNAQWYQQAFQHLRHAHVIAEDVDRTSSFWAYTLLVNDVDAFVQYMRAHDITCSKIHDRNDTKTVFTASRDTALPGVEDFDRHHVCIPVGWWVDAAQRSQIVDHVQAWDRMD